MMPTVDEVTEAVVFLGYMATFGSHRECLGLCIEVAQMEAKAAIAGDCVSAFRLRAARMRLAELMKDCLEVKP